MLYMRKKKSAKDKWAVFFLWKQNSYGDHSHNKKKKQKKKKKKRFSGKNTFKIMSSASIFTKHSKSLTEK